MSQASSEAGTRRKLNDFFISVQHRGLKQIEFAIGDRDEAMDLLQEAMIRLAKSYADQNQEDWPRLFQRIVQNLIKDHYRRQKVRSILVWWQQKDQPAASEEEALAAEGAGAIDGPPANASLGLGAPEQSHAKAQLAARIAMAVKQLPLRQQQAFTLRAWWGHDIQETAFAMECSEGSVKTHYSRALSRLRELLEDGGLGELKQSGLPLKNARELSHER